MVVLLSLRWGCREHFVSGCWHPSGRDCGRYPRECWLSTLGVLHPGVPVIWYDHIRDLSPTAEGCMGGRTPNVTLLHWAQQPWWCKAVMIGWMEVGWEGSPPHIIAHTMHGAHAQGSIFFPSLPGPVVGEMLSATRYAAVGMVGRPLTHVVRDDFCEGVRASPRSGNSTGILPQLLL